MGLNGSIFFVLLSERDRDMVNKDSFTIFSKLKVMILFTCLMKLIWFFKNYCAVF